MTTQTWIKARKQRLHISTQRTLKFLLLFHFSTTSLREWSWVTWWVALATSSIIICNNTLSFISIFIYSKKQLSIVQELNCHKDLCALTCEALGVLQARLPFTWETWASLFRFWTFLWPFISLVVPRTRRGCPTAIICSIIPKRHPTHNNTKPSRQTKPVTKRHYFGTLTRGYGGYGGTLGWCDTLSPRMLSAHLEEATLRC